MNNTRPYEIIVGLETHIELGTKSKMFSDAPNDPFSSKPNTNLTPVCIGMPGTLPVPNREAIHQTLLLGLALNCTIPKQSKFDRKHYFYPDLPKGYQISQYDQPLCLGGEVTFETEEGGKYITKSVRLMRIHLEEDAGKLLHSPQSKISEVDLNRAGVPLIEIVSEADITSPVMARDYLMELRLIARALAISPVDMEKGQLRCDVNINIKFQADNQEVTSYISEVKNLNSFHMVERACAFEAERLYQELQADPEARKQTQKITVGWDDVAGKTLMQRQKEGSADYRYFPEPDIPPLRIYNRAAGDLPPADSDAFDQTEIRQELERFVLPGERRQTLRQQGLGQSEVELLLNNAVKGKLLEDWFKTEGATAKAKTATDLSDSVSKLIIHDLSDVQVSQIKPAQLTEIAQLRREQQISSDIPKQIFAALPAQPNQSIRQLVEQRGWLQLSDEGQLAEQVAVVIAAQPGPVAEFQAGKEAALQFLMGQVMQQTKGQANPQLVLKLLRLKLRALPVEPQDDKNQN